MCGAGYAGEYKKRRDQDRFHGRAVKVTDCLYRKPSDWSIGILEEPIAAENCQAGKAADSFCGVDRCHPLWLSSFREFVFLPTGPRLRSKFSMSKPEIWDVHCHLSGLPGSTPEQRLERLLQFADRVGITKLCISMGMQLVEHPSPEELRQQNDEVLRAIRAFPARTLGLVYLNPQHTQASLDELNRCVRDGPMVGVKLWVAQRCNAPELDPLVKRAAELHAIILQHTWLKAGGNEADESSPFDLAQLASRHPQTAFICGHSGGDWELGLRAIRSHGNIVTELTGSDPTAGFTEMALRELGPERVLYGSDVPGRSFGSQLSKVFGADIPAAAKALMLAGNLKRVLRPILKQKGVAL